MVDDLSSQVEEKSAPGGSGGDGSIVRIRSAIKTLKADIAELNASTGMLSTQLLMHQQTVMSKKLKRDAKKRKSRIMLHGVKALSTSFGGNDSDSSVS